MLWDSSLGSSALNVSHFEFPRMLNVSLSKGNVKLCLAVLLFKYLKSATHLFIIDDFPTDQYNR